jgi:alpha-tubulin suppressor-like RCC1 family protein
MAGDVAASPGRWIRLHERSAEALRAASLVLVGLAACTARVELLPFDPDAAPDGSIPIGDDESMDAGPDAVVPPPPPLFPYVSVTSGAFHTCAILDGGGVVCWGRNESGQLGTGATGDDRSTPVPVANMRSGVQTLASGSDQTCALMDGGNVMCWGVNEDGQLGNGMAGGNRPFPVSVLGLTNVDAISAGEYHTCALIRGDVKCWGQNTSGQLGNGTSGGNRAVPVQVVGLSNGVEAIALGEYHSCALLMSGGVECWGDNEFGQLGNGTKTDSPIPVAVSGLASGVRTIAVGGYHSCALMSGGDLRCWGLNWYGQLGVGSMMVSSPLPLPVMALMSDVEDISAGEYHSCARTRAGAFLCWGQNSSGQIGDGSMVDRASPIPVTGLMGLPRSSSLGEQHSCALFDRGVIECWGDGSAGQLGNGSATNSSTPVVVSAP